MKRRKKYWQCVFRKDHVHCTVVGVHCTSTTPRPRKKFRTRCTRLIANFPYQLYACTGGIGIDKFPPSGSQSSPRPTKHPIDYHQKQRKRAPALEYIVETIKINVCNKLQNNIPLEFVHIIFVQTITREERVSGLGSQAWKGVSM